MKKDERDIKVTDYILFHKLMSRYDRTLPPPPPVVIREQLLTPRLIHSLSLPLPPSLSLLR